MADFGDGIRLAAFPLLAARLTRSPTAVAAVTAVQSLPWLLTGAFPIAATISLLTWQHRSQPRNHGVATS